jgi:hypothetical protein
MKAGILMASLALLGCVTTPTSKWYHPNHVTQEAVDRQYVIDDGRCIAIASGTSPVPAVFGSVSPPVQGTGFAAGLAQGFHDGIALGGVATARANQQRIYRSCMYQLGWTEKIVQE